MKSVVLKGNNKVHIENRKIPELKGHEVLLKVEATLLCGSDLKLINQGLKIGVTLGHECSGTVKKVGPKVQKELLNKRVTVFPMFSCLNCEACQDNRHRDCDNKISLGWDIDGSFSEFVIVDSRFLIELDSNLNFEDGALIEHLACGYRVAEEIKEENIFKNSKIVILGDGPIALANIIFLKKLGFNNIVLLGRHVERMQLAIEFGAKETIDTRILELPTDSKVIIFSAPSLDEHKKLFENNNVNFVIPQTRIHSIEILELITAKKIKVGRGFAYLKEDFFEVMKMITSKDISTDKMISRSISMHSLEVEINNASLIKVPYKTLIVPNLEK